MRSYLQAEIDTSMAGTYRLYVSSYGMYIVHTRYAENKTNLRLQIYRISNPSGTCGVEIATPAHIYPPRSVKYVPKFATKSLI